MSVGGGLAHDGAAQVEVADDAPRSKVKVLGDDIGEIGIGHTLLDGAVRVDVDRQRVGDANGVRELDEGPAAQLVGHEGFGDPTRGVGRGTIDFGGVLTAEGTASVRAPSAVRVNDDLAAGESGVAVRTSDDEASRRIEMVNGLVVEVLFGDDWLDDVFHEVVLDLFLGDILRVLRGDDNGVDADRRWDAILELVLAGDLRLAVGADPIARPVLADFREFGSELRRQHMREGHEDFGFVGRIPEHDALVASSNVFDFDGIDRLSNVRRLFLNGDNDIARLVIKAFGRVVVANVLDGIADDLFVVDRRRRGDLAKDHDHARLATRLARHAGELVAGNASVQHGIGDLIAELVWEDREVENVAGVRGKGCCVLGRD